ncbi:MAG: hypothetical protein PVG92_03140, partial [Holophagae bacterium]
GESAVIPTEAAPASSFGFRRGKPTAERRDPHRESEGLPGGDLSTSRFAGLRRDKRHLGGASLEMTD